MKIFIFEPEIFFDRQLIQHIDLNACFPPLDLNGLFPNELCEVVQNPESADFGFSSFQGF